MAGDILSIGKSGLFAAQAGLTTTGHNISNSNVAGYSRQVVVQQNTAPIMYGGAYYGTGTAVTTIKRFSDDFLNTQVRNATGSKTALDAFNAQIKQVDDLLADDDAGLSPALQSFFAGVQDMAGNGASVPSRQSMLSAAQTLAGRFQSMNTRLDEVRAGVDSTIAADVTQINSYAQQIADLNNQIAGMASYGQNLPNDLLDKRDQLVLELNKYVKADVSPGDAHSLTISIGNGMPLVVGKQAFQLTTTTSLTDKTRVEVGLQTGSNVTILAEGSLTGGELGGMIDFRANVLDKTQSELGRVAVGLALTFNAQHKLGVDQLGNPGQDFFSVARPAVTANSKNALVSTTVVDVAISDPSKLTGADYRVDYDGTQYKITNLSDKSSVAVTPPAPIPPAITPVTTLTFQGMDFTITGATATGDNFLVRPTINGASSFAVAIADTSQIAAGAPVSTTAPLTNKGTATIDAGSVDKNFLASGLTLPMKLTYDAATGMLNGFDPAQDVTVTVNGVSQTYTAAVPPAAPTPIPYASSGATYTVGGVSFTISAGMKDQDSFTIAKASGSGDVRNANLLGALQSAKVLDNGNSTYQSTYAKLVSYVGNKAREAEVNGNAADAMLSSATNAQQGVSGVNLDEEATNLMRYQQAYQAAGKIMQVASTIFDTLLSIGH
jgi:flagellar hook-associated protein 1 FlgK